jgi:hypothetical protein
MTLSLSDSFASAIDAGHGAVTALGCLARTLLDLGRAADADAATARGAMSILGDVPETPRGASPALAAAFDAYARDLGFARGDLAAHASALERLADRCDEEADEVRLLASRLPIGSTAPAPGRNGTVELLNGEVIHDPEDGLTRGPDELVAPVFACDPLLPDPEEIDAQADADAVNEALHEEADQLQKIGTEENKWEVATPAGAVWEAAIPTVAALPPAQEVTPPPLTVEEELGVEAPGPKKRPARKARAKKAK